MTSIRKSLVWSFGERYISQIIVLISSMILARLLTPKEIGIFSLCAAVTAIATIFRDFGSSGYIIQEKNLTKDKLKGVYALTFLTAWIMAGVLFASKGYIADYYNESGVIDVLNILCLNFVILPISTPAFALLNREMAFNKIFLIQVISSFVHAVFAVSLAYLGYSYMSLAWGSFASIVSQTILITAIRPRESFLLPSITKMGPVWRFGLTYSLSRTIDTVMNNSHEFIIAQQFGFAQLGLFSKAQGLINLFWVNVTSAIARVASPSFAKSYRHSKESLVEDYKKSLSFFTVIAWPFFCFVALESRNIIYLLFGEQWLDAAPIASILAISSLISSITSFVPNALVAMGQVKRRLLMSLTLAPFHIFGILLASMFDLNTVAMVWALTWSFGVVLSNYHLKKTIDFSYEILTKSIKKSFWVTLFSIVPVLISFYFFNEYVVSMFISLLVNGCIFVIMWLLAIYVVKHPILNELLFLVKSVLKVQKITVSKR